MKVSGSNTGMWDERRHGAAARGASGRPAWMLLVFLAGLVPVAGCTLQTTIGGQTLPSAYYLQDDVQFYPSGSEEQLPNLRRALEEYKLEQGAGGVPGEQAP